MSAITKIRLREIIDDFVKEIEKAKIKPSKPEETVIDFRNERSKGETRPIWEVPIELLRYRRENGRISSDVLSYELIKGKLDESSTKAQEKVREFLEKKDPEKTEELTNSIQHAGQREPAIITCDGFLINGNRRKMVMERLQKKFPGDEKFKRLRVVILPGRNDVGGPPTLLEIEEIENRYQYQSEGKAEYYGFDRALSMRHKIGIGMTLEAQLRDDPIYASLPTREFKQALKKFENDYLKPLKCADRYLKHLNREGLYETISIGIGDREGRWQAFIDYSKIYDQLNDNKRRLELGVEEKEIGAVEDAAFKIIRKREFRNFKKAHDIIRSFPKLLTNKDSKRELLNINKSVNHKLEKEEIYDKNGVEYDERMKDLQWGNKYETIITSSVKKAIQLLDLHEEGETPKTLLEAALAKLNHKKMELDAIKYQDYESVLKTVREIRKKAQDIETKLYHNKKDYDKLKHS